LVSGGAGSSVVEAAARGCDTYITGEGAHHTWFDAMEGGVNLIYAGHWATETLGVKALAEKVSRQFEVPWEFHSQPTGL
ncbi:MAG: Nif3-like dinuclear metal center hexameric protein, partial [Gemmatimonadales bacterium]